MINLNQTMIYGEAFDDVKHYAAFLALGFAPHPAMWLVLGWGIRNTCPLNGNF
jgi:hypothetical protein